MLDASTTAKLATSVITSAMIQMLAPLLKMHAEESWNTVIPLRMLDASITVLLATSETGRAKSRGSV